MPLVLRFLALGGHRTRVVFGLTAIAVLVTLSVLTVWDGPPWRGILASQPGYSARPVTTP